MKIISLQRNNHQRLESSWNEHVRHPCWFHKLWSDIEPSPSDHRVERIDLCPDSTAIRLSNWKEITIVPFNGQWQTFLFEWSRDRRDSVSTDTNWERTDDDRRLDDIHAVHRRQINRDCPGYPRYSTLSTRTEKKPRRRRRRRFESSQREKISPRLNLWSRCLKESMYGSISGNTSALKPIDRSDFDGDSNTKPSIEMIDHVNLVDSDLPSVILTATHLRTVAHNYHWHPTIAMHDMYSTEPEIEHYCWRYSTSRDWKEFSDLTKKKRHWSLPPFHGSRILQSIESMELWDRFNFCNVLSRVRRRMSISRLWEIES